MIRLIGEGGAEIPHTVPLGPTVVEQLVAGRLRVHDQDVDELDQDVKTHAALNLIGHTRGLDLPRGMTAAEKIHEIRIHVRPRLQRWQRRRRLKICADPSCPELAERLYCPTHARGQEATG